MVLNVYEQTISILSEQLAGATLKRIEWKEGPVERFYKVNFVFEAGGEDERIVGIFGKDLQVSAGWVTFGKPSIFQRLKNKFHYRVCIRGY